MWPVLMEERVRGTEDMAINYGIWKMGAGCRLRYQSSRTIAPLVKESGMRIFQSSLPYSNNSGLPVKGTIITRDLISSFTMVGISFGIKGRGCER